MSVGAVRCDTGGAFDETSHQYIETLRASICMPYIASAILAPDRYAHRSAQHSNPEKANDE
jgi:hypothetical protein